MAILSVASLLGHVENGEAAGLQAISCHVCIIGSQILMQGVLAMIFLYSIRPVKGIY